MLEAAGDVSGEPLATQMESRSLWKEKAVRRLLRSVCEAESLLAVSHVSLRG